MMVIENTRLFVGKRGGRRRVEVGIDAIPTPLDDFFRGFSVFFFNGFLLNGRALDRARFDTIRQFFGNLQCKETPAAIGETHHTLGQ